MKAGRIVDRGTYDELLQTSETFQQLVKAPTER
jgi:ABC-type multidrug transport system fused ATPase/permease subunit